MSTSNFAHNGIYNTTIGIAKRFGGAFRIRHPVCLDDALRQKDPFGSCPLGSIPTSQDGTSLRCKQPRIGQGRHGLCCVPWIHDVASLRRHRYGMLRASLDCPAQAQFVLGTLLAIRHLDRQGLVQKS